MSAGSGRRAPGELAIVLHTHMPYVEGFGTWPFGEEWLWEAVATSYVPLLDVLGRAPITLSLTPVLCDQLESPSALERCVAFLSEVRPESHRRDIEEARGRGDRVAAAELSRSASEYAAVARRLSELGERFLTELGARGSWTSAATHAVLPMLATDAGISLQLDIGIDSHRRRFGAWSGGFWLPECAYAPWLDPLLSDHGVRAACIELTGAFGLGDPRHLRPQLTDSGVVLWPVDRSLMAQVWSAHGYPSSGSYRDYHNHTAHHHRVFGIDGRPYDHDRALGQAATHAREFVARVRQRVAGGGVCVCALDTELLGHWWYEGVHWLEGVVQEAACQGLRLTRLDDALERIEPVPGAIEPAVSSWGDGGDLRTWSGPQVYELAWRARSAELRVVAEASGAGAAPRALRELLALQSSDWAFLLTRELAGEYPRERFVEHERLLDAALGGERLADGLRNLAPGLGRRSL